jgi:ABC-type phosphate/phosphonate transport system substrate-binding protein
VVARECHDPRQKTKDCRLLVPRRAHRRRPPPFPQSSLRHAAVTAALATTPASADRLKLAITDVVGLERLQTEWGPFKAALEAASGQTFEFFPVNNRTAAAEALRAKRVDFVITGPAELVVINKLTDATTVVGLSRPDYFCAIVVMADSPVVHRRSPWTTSDRRPATSARLSSWPTTGSTR